MPAIQVERVGFSNEKLGQLYDDAFTVLVREVGVREDGRADFLRAFADRDFQGIEYRLCGRLGFGGKFRRIVHDGQFRIDCYPEDRNAERDAIVVRVNAIFKTMPFHYPIRPPVRSGWYVRAAFWRIDEPDRYDILGPYETKEGLLTVIDSLGEMVNEYEPPFLHAQPV